MVTIYKYSVYYKGNYTGLSIQGNTCTVFPPIQTARRIVVALCLVTTQWTPYLQTVIASLFSNKVGSIGGALFFTV